ncbi:hypothetical protein RJ641_003771 [Dillenia turbinata]|uniref:Uncharacterized protein n=1 Tax=Dillenia turbinata TaxID=194707 RepID=A0AAN8VHV5_9MAGN
MEYHRLCQLSPWNRYEHLKRNVDESKLIQVGFTFSDIYGNLPDLGTPFSYIWQFNFSDFDPDSDPHSPDSIALLKAQGIDFAKNKEKGINSCRFAALLASYHLVYNWSRVMWVCFHGSYDFAYLMKILRGGDPLPETLPGFLADMAHLFGIRVYDVKQILKFCPGMHGGLERVAQSLQVNRLAGKSHQAGSDSLLTLHIFRKMTQRFCLDVNSLPVRGLLEPNAIGKFQTTLYCVSMWFCLALKTAVGSEAAQARQFVHKLATTLDSSPNLVQKAYWMLPETRTTATYCNRLSLMQLENFMTTPYSISMEPVYLAPGVLRYAMVDSSHYDISRISNMAKCIVTYGPLCS